MVEFLKPKEEARAHLWMRASLIVVNFRQRKRVAKWFRERGVCPQSELILCRE
jgi:hypothetical protein